MVNRDSSVELDLLPSGTKPQPVNMEKTSPQATESSSADEAPDKQSKPPVRSMKSYAWIILVTGVLCATFLFALDNTIVADIQPQIIKELGEIAKLPWITVAFELGAASANLFWGKLYALFNNKILFLWAVVLFEAGSAVCGAAPTMNALIVGRAICGLGGNGIYLGTMNIVSAFTTIQERPLYLSFFGVVWGAGTVLGPIIGGAFTDSRAGWRWSFYINICVGGVLAPIYIFFLPSHRPPKGQQQTVLSRIQNLDFVGITLFVGAFTSGVMAISFGGVLYAWSSGRIIGLFCCSGILWIFFSLQQALAIFTTEEHRLFPVHLLHSYEMCLFFIQTSTSISALFLPVYFIPLFFQFVHTDSALEAGVRLLPFICVGVVFCLFNGGLMGKLGWYMPWYLAGSALIIIGAALMRTMDPTTSHAAFYGYSVILSAGVGAFVQASFPVAQAKVPEQHGADVVAFLGCAQLSALAVAFSVANSVFLNRASDQIAHVLPARSRTEVQTAVSGVGAQVFAGLPDEVKTAVLAAVSNAISKVYDQVLAAGFVSFVIAVFMKRDRVFL